jgi:hypothetical protein
MNYINDNESRFVKPVFSESIMNSQNYSKYPLGEDFYNLIIEDNEINSGDNSKIKDSNVFDIN